jgi:putative ABC transport system permease protein
MGGVSMVVRAELRRRWRSYVALGVLAGVLGAVVLACLAGAARTSSVPQRLRAATGAWDAMAVAYDTGNDPVRADAAIDEVVHAPGVVEVQRFAAPVGRALGSLDWFYPFAFADDNGFYRPPLVSGRWPSPSAPDEVVVSQATARRAGYGLGAVVRYRLYSGEQFAELDEDTTVLPTGARLDLHVVGIVRDLSDLSSHANKLVLGGPALYHRLRALGASPGVLVRLAGSASSFDDFQRAAFGRAEERGVLGPGLILDVSSPLADAEVNRPFETMSTGLLGVAAIAGLVGLVVVVQIVGRHVAGSAGARQVHTALGMSTVERIAAQAAALGVTALVAAAGAVTGALLLSPLFPLGSLRRLEPDGGMRVDPIVLSVGGTTVAIVLLTIGATAVALSARRRGVITPQPNVAVRALVRAGAGPYQIAGARLALEPGRGRRAMPVRAALGGAALGVAGVVGAMVVATNLDRLVGSPDRYGAPAQLSLEVSSEDREARIAELARDTDVDAVGILWSGNLTVAGRDVGSYAVEQRRGELSFTTVTGRAPVGDDEVALGPNLIDDLDVGIGDTVELRRPGAIAAMPFVVVGEALTPLDSGDDFAGQVVVTTDGFERLGLTEGLEGLTAEVGVQVRRGVDVEELYERLDRRHPAEVQDEAIAPRPGPIDLLARVAPLTWLLAGVVGLAGSSALVHALAVGVRRRGVDLGVLRVLGATAGETGQVLHWMALCVATTGLVVGVPAGLIGGSIVWRRIASDNNVVADVALPAAAVGLVVLATLILGVLVAVPAGRRARRLRIIDALRFE